MNDQADISTRILQALHAHALSLLPATEADKLMASGCAQADVEPKVATDERAFVSVDTFHAIAEVFQARLGPDFIEEAISAVASQRIDFSAVSLPQLRAPGLLYLTLDRARSFYAQHIRFEVKLQGRGCARVQMFYRPGQPRRPETCSVARGILRAIPMILNQPGAFVRCDGCYAEGDDHCTYTVRWRASFPFSTAGFGAGGAIASVGAYLQPSLAWLSIPLFGWMIGRAVSNALLNRYRTWAHERQRQALTATERDFRRQFGELEALNASLEERVEQRTNEIRHTLSCMSERNREMRETVARLKSVGSGVVDAGIDALAGEALDEFAHEMKNPLGVVLANLDYLEEAASTPPPQSDLVELQELQEVVADVRHGVDQIRGVLAWFLELCREGGSLGLASYDLNRGAKNAVEMVRHDCEDRITIHTDWNSVPPVPSCGRQIEQVFLNLLVNAVHAVEQGNIWVSTATHDDQVVARVRDDGKGMTPESLERVFERGYTTKPHGVGSGLGLFICQAIVERCGGHIKVTSAVGMGTEVELQLPCWSDPQRQGVGARQRRSAVVSEAH